MSEKPRTPAISKPINPGNTTESKSTKLAQKLLKELTKKPQWNVPNSISLDAARRLVVGRFPNGPDNITLHSPKLPSMLSRQHALLAFSEGKWTVQDLGSLNGVFVNGIRLPVKEATPLKNGDVVCFGVNLATNEFYYTFNASENKAVLKRVETETTPKLIVSIPRALLESGGNKTPSTTTSLKLEINQAATSSALTDTPQYNSTSNLRKKSRSKTLDIDVLFGSQESETGHDSVSKAIFGDDDCQPRSKVKQGMGAADILIQAAQDKMEQEKSHLLSNIEALKSELAAKEKLLVTRDESEKVAESVLKENRDMLSSMQEEFTCVICQELFINAYTLPCAHTFCEWCIKEWMQSKKKKDCPICRKSIASEPVHSLVMDNAISKLVEKLTQEERDAREEVTKLHSNSLKTLTATSSGASVAGGSSRGRRGPRMRGGSLRRRGGRRGRGRRPAQEERAVEVMATFRAGVTVNQAAPVVYVGGRGGGGGSNGPIVISPVHGADRRPPNSPIVISDEEEQASPDFSAVESSSSSSDTSFEEIPGACYGGYGRCYSCGRRGHWAPGCPYM